MIVTPKIIMHLIATNFYGGPEKQIVEHLKRLDPSRYHGIIVSFLEGGAENEILIQAKTVGLKHYGIPMSNRFDVMALWELTRLLRQERVDFLCVHGYKSTVMGWWVGKRSGIPVIAFSRGYTGENKKVAFYEWLERRAIKRVDGIIFVSEGQRKRLEKFGIKGRRNWVVHNAISVNSIGPTDRGKEIFKDFGIPGDEKVVVSAGRLSPEKGHRFLVEAIGMLQESIKNTRFVFCGDGPCRQDLENQSKNLGISDICHFVGFRRDLKEIFQAMDLMVLPSLTEGLPNVVLEAFACSKPVVATRVGGVPEIVEDGVNGVLVLPERPDLLAEAIKDYLADPEKSRMMGEAGYHKVRKDFTLEAQTEKLERIYEGVLVERIGGLSRLT